MPLLRGKPFVRRKTPRNLSDNTPLYFLELTGEAFTEYDEFCYRTIQCNSMVWTCAATDKTDLTFSEALESEKKAKQILESFPESLKVPVLYLASITEATNFQKVVLDVFRFVEKRFFINEIVVPKSKDIWKEGEIVAVNISQMQNVESPKKSPHNQNTPPGLFVYDVEIKKNEKDSQILHISGEKLKRPYGMTKEKLTVFLKHNGTLDAHLIWIVKDSIMQKYNIQFVNYEDFFTGDPPVFSRKTNKKGKRQLKEKDFQVRNMEVKSPCETSTNSEKRNSGKGIDADADSRKESKQKYNSDSSAKQSGQQNIEKYFMSPKKSLIEKDHSNSEEEVIIVSENDSNSFIEVCTEKESNSDDEFEIGLSNNANNSDRLSVERGGDEKWRSQEHFISSTGESGPKSRSSIEKSPRKGNSSLESEPEISPSSHKENISFSNTKQKFMKKLKQTHIFDRSQDQAGIKKNKKINQKLITNKHGFKKGKNRSKRKQKVVGTLKPWVQPAKNQVNQTKCQTIDVNSSKEKRKNWLEVQRNLEIQENLKKIGKRALAKAKQEEEKLLFAKFVKEWRKPREDLLCEDLKPLPVTSEINFRIPNELFGDFMMVLEFFHSFASILQAKSCFPGGLSFEYLERALIETEIAGPLNDIIHVLLGAIFDLQISEYAKPKSDVPNTVDFCSLYDDDMTSEEAIAHATGWSNVFHGIPLHDIPINHVTISEVLRLHLLGSGKRSLDANSKWSMQGGNADLDDPGLAFRMEKPSILQNLSYHHVCELSVGDKLDILGCLINQLLAYAHVRNELEKRCETTRRAKLSLKSVQFAQMKLQKEASAKRIQEKKDVKIAKNQSSRTPVEKDSDVENQKLEREMNKLKGEILKKGSHIFPSVVSHQLLPLGCDRAHRKFWLFSSLPGLYIERNPSEIGPCLPQPTPVFTEIENTKGHLWRLFREQMLCDDLIPISDNVNYANDKGKSNKQSTSNELTKPNKCADTFHDLNKQDETMEDVQKEREVLFCTASDKCPVHQPSLSNSQWSFFPKQEDVTLLLNGLNERGIRENALRRVLIKEEMRITDSIAQCPLHKLNPNQFTEAEIEQRKSTRSNSGYDPQQARLNYPPDTAVAVILEGLLREFILELESKIASACVGSLKVQDRIAWRVAIEKGTYNKLCEKLEWGIKNNSSKAKEAAVKYENAKCDLAVSQEVESTQDCDDMESELATPKRSVQDTEEDTDESDENNEVMVHSNFNKNEDYEESSQNFIEDSLNLNSVCATGRNGNINKEKMTKDEDKCVPSSSEYQQQNHETGNSQTTDGGTENVYTETKTDSEGIDESKKNEWGCLKNSLTDLKTCSESRTDSKTSFKTSDSEIDMSDAETCISSKIEAMCSQKSGSVLYSKLSNSEGSLYAERNIFNTPPTRSSVIEDLACAILQLGQSVDFKFLQRPLVSRSNGRKTGMKYWEVSLMNSINFSQLFIHHSILESSIDWSISALNAPCCVCRRKGNAEKMLLCDGCNKGHHMYCLKPKLTSIPTEDWFCPECSPSERQSNRQKRKKNVLENNDNIANVSKSERLGNKKRKVSLDDVHDDVLSEHSSKIRKVNDLYCKKCAKSGTLVFCTICSEAYHPECLSSTNKSQIQQKENWECDSCKHEHRSEMSTSEDLGNQIETVDVESENGQISVQDCMIISDEDYEEHSDDSAENVVVSRKLHQRERHSKKHYGRELHSRVRRDCASATVAKIASFTKRLRSNSWEDDSEIRSRSDDGESLNLHDNMCVRRSSRKALCASDYLPLDNAILQDLMKEMIQHKDAWPFLRPVRKSEVPDYHQIIKKPMDLGTVKYKLNTAEYRNNREFISDMLLIFENCNMYNKSEAIEFKCGARLFNFFKRKIKQLGLEPPSDL